LQPLTDKAAAPTVGAFNRFFRRYVGGVLVHKTELQSGRKVQLVALALFTLLSSGCGYLSWRALQIENADDPDGGLLPDHMYTRSNSRLKEASAGAMALLTPHASAAVFFGVQRVDRSESSYWDVVTNRGKAEFDLAFDLSDPKSQEAALSLAAALRAAPCSPESCTDLITTFAEPSTGVRFFLEEMQNFHNGSLPVGANFEPALQAWLVHDGLPYSQQVGFVEGRLRFARIDFKSALSPAAGQFENKRAAHSYGAELLQRELADAPIGMRSAVLMYYLLMDNPQTGVAEMIDILAITRIQPYMKSTLNVNLFFGYAFCFVLLLVATRSFRLALMTCLVTLAVVGVLLGGAQLQGKGLDIALLVASTVVVGFSFDYTMHMCMSVYEAEGPTRSTKATYAVGYLGPTLVGATATTTGALLPMIITEARLLVLIGQMICLAILASFVLAILLFIPAYLFFGPAVTTVDATVELDPAAVSSLSVTETCEDRPTPQSEMSHAAA